MFSDFLFVFHLWLNIHCFAEILSLPSSRTGNSSVAWLSRYEEMPISLVGFFGMWSSCAEENMVGVRHGQQRSIIATSLANTNSP
jgi:hypothetical protein